MLVRAGLVRILLDPSLMAGVPWRSILTEFPGRIYIITENSVIQEGKLPLNIVVERYPYNVLVVLVNFN